MAVFQRINAQVCAELRCNLAARFVRLAQNDLGRAGKTCELHEQQTDGTATDYANDVAHLDLCTVDAVQATGERFAHRAVFKRHVRIQQQRLCGGYDAVFLKAAVHRNANGFHVTAHLLFAVAAVFALAAIYVRIDGDMITDLESLDALAHFRDDAGILMAEHDRRVDRCAALFAVVNVHVRAAYAASVVLDNDRARLCLRNGALMHLKCLVAHKIRCFHDKTPHVFSK